ncbi:MAG: DUF3473 domain-containing protein [Desulfobacterota bacterium]|nr:DUF3473 domain-containing protein [Thermodesulfobacteriota bacterium]
MIHGLSVDVEDYHQIVSKNYLDKDIAPSAEVERNTLYLLETFAHVGVKATFFVLANVARAYPALIRQIAAAGHEVGVHGYEHTLIYTMSRSIFKSSIARAKEEIEAITGCAVQGHRAPAFSITKDAAWAYDILKELGFVYDSSVYPIRGKRYGIPDAPRHIHRLTNGLYEVPLASIKLLGFSIPVAGGGYLRYFPFFWTVYAMKRIEHEGRPAVVFIHPYEFEETPPSAFPYGVPLPLRLKLHNTLQAFNRGKRHRGKLRSLLARYRFAPIRELVQHYAHCLTEKADFLSP